FEKNRATDSNQQALYQALVDERVWIASAPEEKARAEFYFPRQNETDVSKGPARGFRFVRAGSYAAPNDGRTRESTMKRTILAACPFALALCAWPPSAHAALTANIVCYLWANHNTVHIGT